MNSIKKGTYVIILITLLISTIPIASAQTYQLTVQGVITDSETGKGIYDATVTIGVPGNRVLAKTQTLKDGTYSITAIWTYGTTWELRASKSGYSPASKQFQPYDWVMYENLALVRLNIAPTANANGPYSGKVNQAISFSSAGSNDPDGSIVSYHWDFKDGSFSTSPNPTHAFTSQAIYSVVLTVTDNEGLSSTDTAVTTIIALKDPIAEANGPYSAEVDQEIVFNSTGSSDPDGTIVEYRWDFGDGIIALGHNASHAYTEPGNFTVTLRVQDNDGRTHEDTANCTILPKPVDPIAEANGPYTATTGFEVSFSSTGSVDPDGYIVEYEWDFGDGSATSTAFEPSHIYDEVGTYTVTLTVIDNTGAIDSDTATVTVNLPPNELPTAEAGGPYEVQEDDELVFSSAGSSDSDGVIEEYEWNFGDGSPISNDENPVHVYENHGNFTATLTVTDDRGGSHSDSVSIIVTKKPGFPWLPILAVLIIAAAAAAYYFLVMKKEKVAKPTSLNLSTETTEIPADGRSTALVTIELRDESGEPIATPNDIQVNLETSSGNITSPVVIKAEQTSSNATITSSVDIGVAHIKAESSGLRSASISLTFTEKRRYCMHCGAQMSLEDHVCPKCGQSPPSGVDVKECQNCGEVIPSVAKFCSECGARQPDAFENEDTEEEEDSGETPTST